MTESTSTSTPTTAAGQSHDAELRRLRAIDRGTRIGGTVVAAMLAALWLDNSITPIDGTALGWSLLSQAMIALIGLTTALALRQPRRDAEIALVAREATALVLVTSAVVTATGVGPAPSNALSHVPIIMLMNGFALLLPLRPLPLGLPTLGVVALMWPIGQLLGGHVDPTGFAFALRIVELVLGLCLAGIFMVLHNALFENRARALVRLARLAEHDGLTGVLNRRALTGRLATEVDRARRYGGGVSVLMYDIDRFKRFNAQLGYAAGDRMLTEVARLLDGMLELQPWASLSGAVGRYGGEEFVVVLPTADAEIAGRFADESRAAIASLRVHEANEVLVVTVSVGCVSADAVADATSLIGAADAAMYRAKDAGGDRVERAQPGAARPRMNTATPFEVRRGPRTTVRDEARADLEAVHGTMLRWGLVVAGVWFFLFWPLDVAARGATGVGVDAGVSLLVRAGWSLSVLAIALVFPGRLLVGRRTARTHAVVTVLAALATIGLARDAAPEVEITFFTSLVIATLAWAGAISATSALSFGTLGAVCAAYLGATAMWGDSAIAQVDVPYRAGLLIASAVVALASQRLLTALRLDETQTRLELDEMARFDALTGLPNRTAFMQRLREEIKRAGDGGALGVCMIDLDHFKRLNDTLGHLAGDRALIDVAEAARSVLRGADVVARLGGEEFALVLPHTSLEAAEGAAQRLRQAIAARSSTTESWDLTASAGVTTWAAGESATDVLSRADAALRAAKRGGRDRVCIAPPPEAT